MKRVRKQSFTLVEVIAVLLVIGILAAVAAPKFVSIATEARAKVAQAGINEAKASLSVAYAKAYLALEGTNPSPAQVVANATGITDNGTTAFGDVNVQINSNATANTVDLTALNVKGTAVSGVTDTWTLPQN